MCKRHWRPLKLKVSKLLSMLRLKCWSMVKIIMSLVGYLFELVKLIYVTFSCFFPATFFCWGVLAICAIICLNAYYIEWRLRLISIPALVLIDFKLLIEQFYILISNPVNYMVYYSLVSNLIALVWLFWASLTEFWFLIIFKIIKF